MAALPLIPSTVVGSPDPRPRVGKRARIRAAKRGLLGTYRDVVDGRFP